MAYAGTIRGAIAFGLSVSVNTGNKLLDSMISTGTLTIVIFTIIVFGIFLPLVVSFFKSFENTKTLEEKEREEQLQRSLMEKQQLFEHKKSALKRRSSITFTNYEDAFNHEFSYFHPNNCEE